MIHPSDFDRDRTWGGVPARDTRTGRRQFDISQKFGPIGLGGGDNGNRDRDREGIGIETGKG